MFPTLTQEQQQAIAQIQTLTQFIRAEVHKNANGSITITLLTDNEQAKTVLPQIQEALVSSTANVLYMLFGISGKVT